MSWPTKKLGELISKYFSGTWGEDPKSDGNARVIRVSDIKPDFSINYENVPIRRLKEKDLNKYRLELGDIVVVKSSGNQTKIISGRAALFEYKGKDVFYVPSNFLIALRPNCNLIIPMWLWVNLNSKTAKRFIELIIGATTYPNLKPAEYLNLKIPVPPLPIQQKIVERLDAIKKAQELNDKQIELAEELFQSLLHRELDPKGKNWEVKKLGDVCEIARGGSPRPINKYLTKSSDGINWIKIGDVKEGEKYITSTAEKIKPEGISKTRLVQEGDLILSNSMSFGRPYILKISGAIHDGWLLLHINNANEILQDFLYYILGTTQTKIQFEKFASGGVVKNLNSDLVRRVKIPLPPLETQQKIVEKLSAVQEYKKKLLDQKQKLQELFESVLNKSFKGELVG